MDVTSSTSSTTTLMDTTPYLQQQTEESSDLQNLIQSVLAQQAILIGEVATLKKENATLKKKDKVREIQLTTVHQQLDHNNQQLAEIQGRKMHRALGAAATVTKILVKVGLTSMVFHIGKLVSLETAKAVSKTAAKYIPFVGLGVGAVACVYRLAKEDITMAEWVKAIAELGSGVASVFLGVGTLIAFLIDMATAGHDMYEIYHSPDADSEPHVCIEQEHELTLKDAYQTLGIQSESPTQREVDKAYRLAVKKLHPDSRAQLEDGSLLGHRHDVTVLITECRDLIYKEKSWI